jgi:hypothetical protein
MTLADLFDWFALDSKHVAEQTDDPKQAREVDEVGRAVGGRRTTEL